MTLVASSIAVLARTEVAEAAPPTATYWPQAAYEAAYKSGKPVEILSLTTATTRIWAEPSGRASADINAVPVRLERDGKWLDFDMTLERNADGTIRPKVHPKDLVLAGPAAEGEHDLATISVNGQRLGLGWQGRIPEPRLDGDTATYPEILPGVDLTVQARSGGFEQFFVIKNVEAAARVAGLELPVRSGRGIFAPKADGTGEWLGDGGKVVARMPLPLTWDAQPAGRSGERPRQTRMGLSLRQGKARLGLDLAWFRDPATRYPVTVDPGLVLDPGAGFDEFVQNTYSVGDNQSSSELKLGFSDDTAHGCTACKARSYLRFDNLAGFKGAKIYSAKLQLWEFHSWSCTAFGWRATRTDSVSGSVQWGNEPTWREDAPASTETKGYSGSCAAGWVSTDVAPVIDDAFANGWSTAAMVIHAVGDDNKDNFTLTNDLSWKKFDSNEGEHKPKIHLEYDHIPAVSSVRVQDDGSCGVGAAYRKYLPTTTLQPTFKAYVKDDDKAPQPSTNVKIELELVSSSGTKTTVYSDPGAPNSTLSAAPAAPLDVAKIYTYRVRPWDLYPDGSLMEAGAWSAVCELAFDSATLTDPPIVEGLETQQPEGPGTEIFNILRYGSTTWLTFRPTQTDLGRVAAYRYGFSQQAVESPNAQTVPAGPDGTATVPVARWEVDGDGYPTSSGQLFVRAVTITGSQYSTNVLDVYDPLDSTTPPVTHVRGDVNGDGKADVAGFRDLSATEGVYYSFYGRGNGTLEQRAYLMRAPYSSANAKVAQGDFTGDGKTDFAAFVADGANDVVLKALTSDGTGLREVEVWSSKTAGTAYAGKWALASLKVLAGDADADGRDDLIVATGTTSSWMLKTFVAWVDPGTDADTPNDDQLRFGNPSDWLAQLAMSDWNKLKLVVGEFDGQPGTDVAEFYDHGSCRTAMYLHERLSGQALFAAGHLIWDSTNTSAWCWANSQFASGHYGASTSPYSGIVATYDFGGCNMGIYTFTVEDTDQPGHWYPHTQQWTSGTGTEYWCAGSTELTLRDTTGDGQEDSVLTYRCCGAAQQRVWTMTSSSPTIRVSVRRAPDGTTTIIYSPNVDLFPAPVLRTQGAVGPVGVGDLSHSGATRYQVVSKYSGLCVSVHDGVNGAWSTEGAINTQQPCAAGILSGQYTLEQRGAAYVRLHPVHDPDKCLNISGALSDDGRPLIQNTCTPGQSNESFQIEYVTGASSTARDPNEIAVRFVSNLSGKCLDIQGPSIDAGTKIHQWPCQSIGYASQTFFLRPVAPTNNGLLANWNMTTKRLYDNPIGDASGRQASAAITANGVANHQMSGVLTLDGSTGYARTNGAVINTRQSFTVSAWVNLDTTGRYQTVVAQEGSVYSAFYLQATPAGKWGFTLSNAIYGGAYSGSAVTSTTPSATGTWVHLVGVYDLSMGQARLYVNGVLEGSVAVTTGVAASGNLVIGAARSNSTRVDFVDGQIDDVRAWERALSDSEIAALYATGAA
ncbi:LamG-like jellyroll fold domain-containing protein [Hamadaea sp. NPDC050747]|uniref:LamG-like jellyroll fold domain-containing protein n=1 Tax=Hamadaea sp. NPDC050747 TaxID=3155789 RepID=UPI003407FE57